MNDQRASAAPGEGGQKSHTPGDGAGAPRWFFVLALRDVLPLDEDGHQTWFRDLGECPPGCADLWTCAGSVVKLVQRPAVEGEFHEMLAEVCAVAHEMMGTTQERIPLPEGPEGFRTLAVVSLPAAPDDDDEASNALDRCLEIVQMVVNALRLATGAHFPRFSPERLWPAYAGVRHGIVDPGTRATL